MFPEELEFNPPGAWSARRARLWPHAVLLAATFLTTTLVGARMQLDFDHNLPFLTSAGLLEIFTAWRWEHLALGLPYSLTLLVILMAHEMGHYLACLRYGLDASLPYFLPAPAIIGTFGAFIRIRSPIYSRRALFDVAVAGPIAGFILLIPALAAGLAWSKVIPGIATDAEIRFGAPLLEHAAAALIFPGTPASDIYLHPVARAAGIGLLATAWNLLPVGQLDGGHILYALAGERHRHLTLVFLAALFVMGLVYWRGWIVWSVVLFLVRRHPVIHDPEPLDGGRRRVAWGALAIFALSFTPAPFEGGP